jgi:Domain of unknown function (DUF1911)/Domain of unknown function (DUF1910)
MSELEDGHTRRSPAGLRCHQPGVTRQGLDREIEIFEKHLRTVPTYAVHLRWWIARFSRGDDLTALREDFASVVDQVDREALLATRGGGDVSAFFAYDRGFIGRYRHALVLLSIALCLGLPDLARRVLYRCQRGDALIERLARANGAPQARSEASPPFPEEFDGLYAASDAPTQAAAADAIRQYLPIWLGKWTDDMDFKVADEGLGYWCFEAAGVVAALDLDDNAFADEQVYPRDLVAFYREGR